MSRVDPELIRRQLRRRYLLRLSLRIIVIGALIALIGQRHTVYGSWIAAGTLLCYLTSLLARQRSEGLSDMLLTLGDIPAIAGVMHLLPQGYGFEALLPAWLIGITVANLRGGRPALLPLHSSAAWLILISRAPAAPFPWSYAVVQTLAIAVASVVALAIVLEQRLHRIDSLTGVLTRRAGLEKLQTLPVRDGITLAFIDLRHFKTINDRYGHATGDEVLTIVARRLNAALRHKDVLFRYGGDEFIVASTAPELELRLQAVFATPVRTSLHSLKIDARIGIEHKHGAIDVDVIVKEADRRMYAKREAPELTIPVPLYELQDSPQS